MKTLPFVMLFLFGTAFAQKVVKPTSPIAAGSLANDQTQVPHELDESGLTDGQIIDYGGKYPQYAKLWQTMRYTPADLIKKGWLENHTLGLKPNSERHEALREQILAGRPLQTVQVSFAFPCDMGRQLRREKPVLTAEQIAKGWTIEWDPHIKRWWILRRGYVEANDTVICELEALYWEVRVIKVDGAWKQIWVEVLRVVAHDTCGNIVHGVCIRISTPKGVPAKKIRVPVPQPGKERTVFVDRYQPQPVPAPAERTAIIALTERTTTITETNITVNVTQSMWVNNNISLVCSNVNGTPCPIPGLGNGLPFLPGVGTPPDAPRFGPYDPLAGLPPYQVGAPGTGGYRNMNGGH